MEHGAFLRSRGEQHDGTSDLVDGREFHLLVAHGVRTAAQHIVYLDAAHERVGGEVGLELTVGASCGEVTYAHDLGIESVKGNGVEDETLGHELRVNVFIAEELSHVETLLGEDIVLGLASPESAGAGRGDMHQTCAFLDAEVNAMTCASDIDILDFGALGEVLHDGGTVEDRLDVEVLIEVLSDIAQQHMDALAEQGLEGIGEVIVEQRAQAALGGLYRLSADETIDIVNVGIDELAQDVNAQIARGACDEHIADGLTLTLTESIECVALEEVVDGGIVEARHLVGSLGVAITRDEACQFSWRGIGKHIAVGYMHAGLVGLDDDAGDDE